MEFKGYKHLRLRNNNITLFLNNYKQEEFEGYKFNPLKWTQIWIIIHPKLFRINDQVF